MYLNEGRPINRKKVSAIPENVQNAIALAIKADIAAGRTQKGTVKIDNPDCVEYPCQCPLYYCCMCSDGLCASVCLDGCDSFSCTPCGVSICSQDSDCTIPCEDSGLSCRSVP